MFTRRTFLSTAAAGLAMPAVANAQFKLDPKYNPQYVSIQPEYAPGQILVLLKSRFLYLVEEQGKALRYGISVGRAGLEASGTSVVQHKKKWPTWRPTDAMMERDPHLYKKFIGTDYVQPGGPNNPLGERALYLFKNGRDTYERIHGTNSIKSIGRAASNGCFRMANEHVKDLYDRVPVGTKVTVL